MRNEISRNRKGALFFLFCFIFVGPALCYVSAGNYVILNIVSYVFLVSGMGMIVYGFRLVNLVCPACGKAFLRRGLKLNPFAKKCLNCGFSE